LNRNWTKADGGEFNIYESWPEQVLQEEITPKFGKAILFRSDLLHHSAEAVHT
jgi:Rps23 Pro-64 3,4-dihydroxylase Tpa1-like proline 4-hydroxylase